MNEYYSSKARVSCIRLQPAENQLCVCARQTFVALRDKVRAALWETFVTATKISDLNFTPPAAVTELAAKVKAFVK